MKRAGKQSGAAATATNRGEAVAKTATAPQAIPAKRKAAQLAVALAPKAAKRARADVTSTAVEEDVDDASSGDFSSGTESDDLDLTRVGGRDDASIDSDEDSGSDVDTINVDFECVGPSEIDFKSVRRLLEHYLPGEEATFDISSMAEAIIAETRVGTMVKIEGDLDVYAFATIIPIVRFQESKWLKDIKSYMLDKLAHAKDLKGATQKAAIAQLTSLFSSPRTGLLINERVVNMPAEIVPPMHNLLLEDLQGGSAGSSSSSSSSSGAPEAYDTLLALVPCFQPRDAAADDTSYFHFEDELFAEHSTLTFSFPVEIKGFGVGSDAAPAAATAAHKGKAKPKQRGRASGKASAKDDSDSDEEGGDESTATLRPAQSRRLAVFPFAALAACTEAMAHAVGLAQAAELKAAKPERKR